MSPRGRYLRWCLVLATLLAAESAGGGASMLAAGTDSGVDLFFRPLRVFVDGAGRIYVADTGNSRIVRMNDAAGGGWTTLGSYGSGVTILGPGASKVVFHQSYE